MRKRKRESGSYVDEETGEVTTVQTTKQAKRIHQKSGKWYKEPTAKELRIWEREAKQKELAEKALRREQNKKKNAAKRAEKEAKELELKRQEFFAGKITFTQTLAKKEEDQLNLHSWFGGKLQKQKSAESLLKTAQGDQENKEVQTRLQTEVSGESSTAHKSSHPIQTKRLSIDSDQVGDLNVNPTHLPISPIQSPNSSQETIAKRQIPMDFNENQDIDMSQCFEDFDIAEDLDVAPDESGEGQAQSESNDVAEHEFRIPAPPNASKRLPLSPMSKSDVNVRNSQTQGVSDFKSKLAESGSPLRSPTKMTSIPSTQMVKDLLSGLCTQDLDDDDLEEDQPDKENQSPWMSADPAETGKASVEQTAAGREISPSKSPSKVKHSFQRVASLNDSFNGHDYDNIFAELGETIEENHITPSDFDDGGLDDATLLSLPATQILLSTTQPALQMTTAPDEIAIRTNQSSPKALETIRQCDSFAIDGLSDHDLLQGLAQYEQSQTGSTHDSSAVKPKTTRLLPWHKPGWAAETSGGQSQEDTDMIENSTQCSQRTEILSQWT